MIDIITIKGEKYSFDPTTDRVFKDGLVIPSSQVEPIYSDANNENSAPRFSGLLLKATQQILSLSGKLSSLINSDNLTI